MTRLLDPRSSPLLSELARKRALIVLDYDGTLVPIVTRPEDAVLTARGRDELKRLERHYPVAVLTGRSLRNIRQLLSPLKLRLVVGNHGNEWPGENGKLAEFARQVAIWHRALEPLESELPGVEIEDKRISLSVHFRACEDPPRARAAIAARLARLKPKPHVIGGKAVFNVLSRDAANKGDALRELERRLKPAIAVFVGDDVTDEDGFRAVARRRNWITIKVGPGRTSARYRLSRQSQIHALIGALIRAID